MYKSWVKYALAAFLFILLPNVAEAQYKGTVLDSVTYTEVSNNFKNLSAKAVRPDSVVFIWNNANQLDPSLLSEGNFSMSDELLIRFKPEKAGDDEWVILDPISNSKVKHNANGFKPGTKYKWQLGVNVSKNSSDDNGVVWSESKKFETLSGWGFWNFLVLLGSLGIFIYGMKIMSEGLQKLAGQSLRRVLKGMTSTRVSGVLTGTFVTTMIQSSSATTVMVVSFVNAGLLTLSESMGVVMGANIGTTVTAWMVAYFGFKVKIVYIATILIGVFFPFLFTKRETLRRVAEFILGFGILFIGLDFLKGSVPDIKANPEILSFLNQFTDAGFLSILLFIAVGTILTIVVQSSSATTAITLVMLSQGWVPYHLAAAMVLGENIGTTITANIAASIGNVHAKRTARFHTLFNLIGVMWMLIVFNWFVPFIETQAASIGLDNKMALALFHTSFNILNVVLLFGFVPFLEKIVIRLQPSRGSSDEETSLRYISSGLMSTPELSLQQARKELQFFGKLIDKMSFSFSALLFERHKNTKSILEKIKKREDITDNLEIELINYLTKVSESNLSSETSEKVRNMIAIANEFERVADLIYEMSRNFERSKGQNVKLPDEAMEELKELMDIIYRGIKMTRRNLEIDASNIDMEEVQDLEKLIKRTRKELTKSHHTRLEKNAYTSFLGVVYLDYVNKADRIGAHIVTVNESLAGIK